MTSYQNRQLKWESTWRLTISVETNSSVQSVNSNVLIREMLQQHIETTHRRSKIFKCDSCVFECTKKTNIQLHIKTEHAGGFECDKCSFKCGCRDILKEHKLKKHECVFVYLCTVCEEEYLSKDRLKAHVDKQHNNFTCQVWLSNENSILLLTHVNQTFANLRSIFRG